MKDVIKQLDRVYKPTQNGVAALRTLERWIDRKRCEGFAGPNHARLATLHEIFNIAGVPAMIKANGDMGFATKTDKQLDTAERLAMFQEMVNKEHAELVSRFDMEKGSKR